MTEHGLAQKPAGKDGLIDSAVGEFLVAERMPQVRLYVSAGVGNAVPTEISGHANNGLNTAYLGSQRKNRVELWRRSCVGEGV